jgi:hypothetical protein
MQAEERVPPRGVAFGLLARLADRVPGGSIAKAGIGAVEHVVNRMPAVLWVRSRIAEVERDALRSLSERLAQLNGAVPITLLSSGPAPEGPALLRSRSPADEFAELLEEGEGQSPAEARRTAMLRIVRELVPDEARILRALADGSEFAVLQAYDGNDHIVRNRSNVGRNAKVHAQELTSTYVTHLLGLGLVNVAPYEGTSLYEYELIEAEPEVREILGHYDHRKLMKPKISRQVLRLSPAGQKFCGLCLPR